MMTDTIAAISTSIGEAAISVVRLSGPQAIPIAAKVLRARKPLPDWTPRLAYLTQAVDPQGLTLDQGIALLFRAPASYTGEPTIEFHGHGGVLVTQRILEAFLQAGARPAEPGEFTQRAFLNGKIDLTQAEAVMDLIHAQSTLALRAANEQLAGTIGQQATALRTPLIDILAHIEAYIDFPEEDISPDTGTALQARLTHLITRTRRLLDTAEQGRILRHGARTVIVGQPNVGKSSLLNCLLGFQRAIVSPTAGTTRDTIEEIIQVHGIPLRLVDTAGLREGGDEIERIGIQRTHQELERADLIIEVIDASLPASTTTRIPIPTAASQRHLILLNKSDLGLHPDWSPAPNALPFSSTTASGIDQLRSAIQRIVLGAGSLSADHPIAINARHKNCFQRVESHLTAAQAALQSAAAPEFIALDLREALQALGDVIGQTDIEQILDVIFSSFCIGK
jgi:tRNA modification GTPase